MEKLEADSCLTLSLLTHGKSDVFHRLLKNSDPMAMGWAHPNIYTIYYKCAAGIETLLVEYLLMQNGLMTGEKNKPKTREELVKVIGGMPLLMDLCLAMSSAPLGKIRLL